MRINLRYFKRGHIACTAIILIGYVAFHIPVWPFFPVFYVLPFHEREKLASVSPFLTQEDADAIGCILNKYNEKYLWANNVIFVSHSLFFDKELRWNYTTKSGMLIPLRNFQRDSSSDGAPPRWIELRRIKASH